MCLLDRGDGVTVIEDERLVGGCGDADLGARATCNGFVEQDLLDEGRVLDQTEQCGPGRNQRTARLFFGQSVKAAVERCSVLVEEHLELGPGWLIEDTLDERRGEGRHLRSLPGSRLPQPCRSLRMWIRLRRKRALKSQKRVRSPGHHWMRADGRAAPAGSLRGWASLFAPILELAELEHRPTRVDGCVPCRLMDMDYLAVPYTPTSSTLAVLRRVLIQQPESLTTIYSLETEGRLVGAKSLVRGRSRVGPGRCLAATLR